MMMMIDGWMLKNKKNKSNDDGVRHMILMYDTIQAACVCMYVCMYVYFIFYFFKGVLLYKLLMMMMCVRVKRGSISIYLVVHKHIRI